MPTRPPLTRVPAPALVLAAAVSVQGGATVAVKLFPVAGPVGTVWLRLALSALLMLALARPQWRAHGSGSRWLAAGFGVALAAMNTSFYLAIDRIPLGVAVTVEFIGPLAVAVAGSRRRIDLVWVALAGAGVALLAGVDGGTGGTRLDPAGLALAATAGGCWAAYIVLSQQVGRHFPGAGGLTIALVVAALGLTPAALALRPAALTRPEVWGAGLAVAVLSSAIPYSLELNALRRVRAGTFGVLLSLDPAVAALFGWAVLGQHLRWSEWLAVGCVVVASAAASRERRTSPDTGGLAGALPPRPPEPAGASQVEASR